MKTTLLAAALALAAAAAPAFAQDDNDAAARLREGAAYSRGESAPLRHHRVYGRASRRRAEAASAADRSADQLNQRQLDQYKR